MSVLKTLQARRAVLRSLTSRSGQILTLSFESYFIFVGALMCFDVLEVCGGARMHQHDVRRRFSLPFGNHHRFAYHITEKQYIQAD